MASSFEQNYTNVESVWPDPIDILVSCEFELNQLRDLAVESAYRVTGLHPSVHKRYIRIPFMLCPFARPNDGSGHVRDD